jgi:carbamoyltransferase
MEKVALAGGVALNCKMNKRIMESDAVEELFVQPVAHDGGGSRSVQACSHSTRRTSRK